MQFLRVSYSDISSVSGKIIYLHDGKDIGSGAFELKEKSEFRILLPRSLGVVSVFAKIYNDSFSSIKVMECESSGIGTLFDTYSFRAEGFEKGLYFFSIIINSVAGRIYGMKGSGTELVISKEEEGSHFQFSVVDFKYPSPSRYHGGIIYHVFVDRFARSGNITPREDAVIIEDWDNGIPEYPQYPGAHLENNTFFGGNLYGVVDKLDYIKSLGADLIYLSPIFEAYSNHKYDTGNYMKVDEMFGGDEALSRLVSEARKRDIGIILDGVFNHTGSDSLYFNQKGRYKSLGAYQSKKSEYYSWYNFEKYPEKYTCWWGIKILPRINPDIKECGEYIAGEGGVIEKYSKMGISGFRLDVADELSDNFIAKIKSKLEENSEGSILYGEVWEDASNKIAYDKRKKYYLGDELDGVMNYPLRDGIIAFLRDKNTEPLRYAFLDVFFNSPKRIRDTQMNLLGTHDTERIITVLAADSAEGKSNAELSFMKMSPDQKKKGIALLKLAYTILATVPGLPTVFYGDEAGLEGYKDPFNRRPFPWSKINEEILEHYCALGRVRKENPVYKCGDFKLLHLDAELLSFARLDEDGYAYVTIVNNSSHEKNISFSSSARSLISGTVLRKLKLPSLCAQIIKVKIDCSIEFE